MIKNGFADRKSNRMGAIMADRKSNRMGAIMADRKSNRMGAIMTHVLGITGLQPGPA